VEVVDLGAEDTTGRGVPCCGHVVATRFATSASSSALECKPSPHATS
jgi:hypothetical protein